MIDGFEINCKRCGNAAVDIKGTAEHYGAKTRVKFTCLSCGYEVEVPVSQNSLVDFVKDLRKKKEKVETLGNFLKNHTDKFIVNGKIYRKLGRYEKIEKGAMQSFNNNGLSPIANPSTMGMTPNDFSAERDFYNPI